MMNSLVMQAFVRHVIEKQASAGLLLGAGALGLGGLGAMSVGRNAFGDYRMGAAQRRMARARETMRDYAYNPRAGGMHG